MYDFTERRLRIQEQKLATVGEVEQADQNYLKQGTENQRESQRVGEYDCQVPWGGSDHANRN